MAGLFFHSVPWSVLVMVFMRQLTRLEVVSAAGKTVFLGVGWKLHFWTAWLLVSASQTKLWGCGQITPPLEGFGVHISRK